MASYRNLYSDSTLPFKNEIPQKILINFFYLFVNSQNHMTIHIIRCKSIKHFYCGGFKTTYSKKVNIVF
jgi:hypothetical protein